MFIATAVVSVLLALVLVASGGAKLAKSPQVMPIMETVGFPADKVWLLAAAEVAGAVGLVVGLFWSPIGVAAAAGVVLYFVGAVISHLRVNDKNFAAALVLLLVALAALVLRLLTA
jgi:uncharacterized membrane protein YphA (DoxX/SURF4 family)